MTEHATDGQDPTLRPNGADVITLPVRALDSFQGKTYSPEGLARFERTDILSELDTSLTGDDVRSIAHGIAVGEVFSGVENMDRPIALTEWILSEAHVSTGYKRLIKRQDEHNRLREDVEKKRGLKNMTAEAAAQKLAKTKVQLEKTKPLTPYELRKVAIGKSVSFELQSAVESLATIASEQEDLGLGKMGLLDALYELEEELKPRIAGSNAIRIYNALYDVLRSPDTNRPSPDLIIAGRILILFMKNRLEPTVGQS